ELQGSAADTVFIGGSISAAVIGATSATRFVGTAGVNNTVFIGDFGLGSSALEIVTDWDDTALRSGIYGTDSTTTTGT
ncbi:hypothetical protein, partial [Streptococcus pseudopneumoniae]|uniref:hypothetical protein n=1 Tax=Streptococcus pseudopneumoniae TaxID=257758 RepID=UPI0019D5E8B3